MRLYLDICCLKRPFDDQAQPRIAVETAAVIAILAASERGEHELVRSAAHYLENGLDPDDERRSAVAAWLAKGGPPESTSLAVQNAFAGFRAVGLGQMDALHLAWAEMLGVEMLLTTDDRFESRASRLGDKLSVRVMNPSRFIQEQVR